MNSRLLDLCVICLVYGTFVLQAFYINRDMLDLNIDNKAAFNRDHYVRFDRLLIANPGSPLNLLNQ